MWKVGGVVSKRRQGSNADLSLKTGKQARTPRGEYRAKRTCVRCNNIANKGQVNEDQVRPIKAAQTEVGSAEQGIKCMNCSVRLQKSHAQGFHKGAVVLSKYYTSPMWTRAQIA